MTQFSKIKSFNSKLSLPGDKSISHRSLIFSAMASETSTIENLSNSVDVNSTKTIMEAIGAKFTTQNGVITVEGCGYKGFKEPKGMLDAGNSGTTSRLLLGMFAAQNFKVTIFGDESLSKRPMKRIIDPLTQLGAKIESENGYLPVTVSPTDALKQINYTLPIASAQLKSAIILAGLHLESESTIIEKIPSRNHTEVMLGIPVEKTSEGNLIKFSKNNYPKANQYFVPGDISSSAFFVVLTLLNKDSELIIENVSLNETRTGFIDILKAMNAQINILETKEFSGEKIGTIQIKSSQLKNIEIPLEIIPNIIDEIPILAIAGALSEGRFTVRGAKELRVKESDRIQSVCDNLRLLGLVIDEFEDGFSFEGKKLEDKEVCYESYDDHRIAMSFAVLSMLLKNGGKINGFDCVKISNPKFLSQLAEIIQ